MRPMLDEIELPNVQAIITHDQRQLAQHDLPGMAGTINLNMGRSSGQVWLQGIAAGTEALSFLEQLDTLYRSNEPLPFITDIVSDMEIEQLLVRDVRWKEIAGRPERYAYELTLIEYIEPKEPESTSFLDADILDDALGLVDDLIDGLDIGFAFATGLEPFVGTFTELLGRTQDANSDQS